MAAGTTAKTPQVDLSTRETRAEIMPEEAGPYVRVMATGRSDYPDQINNSCCFPASSAACSTCG